MITIAIHGGAGTVTRAELTPEQEIDFRAGIGAGYQVLAATRRQRSGC